MTRRLWIGMALVCVTALPGLVYAHQGHVHTVRGTVTQRDDKQLVIRTEDGKTVAITMNVKTVVSRDDQKADRAALQAGQRVVVDVGDGKAPLVARTVKLAGVPGQKKK